jgi:hypothetical protein
VTEADFRDFAERSKWVFAKTMPDNPHEYVLRRSCADEQEFEAAVRFIREHGYRAKFGGRYYTYYALDGWKFWTMGWPVEQTILINRAKL